MQRGFPILRVLLYHVYNVEDGISGILLLRVIRETSLERLPSLDVLGLKIHNFLSKKISLLCEFLYSLVKLLSVNNGFWFNSGGRL